MQSAGSGGLEMGGYSVSVLQGNSVRYVQSVGWLGTPDGRVIMTDPETGRSVDHGHP